MEIISYLSFVELLDLRLVCRGFALLATSSALSQSYWRSRFCIGQEADFLFPRLTETQNWARLFVGLSVSLKNDALHLINRKRIRKLLEPLAALWDSRAVFRNGPCGTAFCPEQNKHEGWQNTDSTGSKSCVLHLQIGHSFYGQLPTFHIDGPLQEGCRALYNKAQSLKPPQQPIKRQIGISTIQIGAFSFISGINLYPAADSKSADHAIGYRIPTSEKWVEIPPRSELRAICVAFRSEGLTGVRFVFEDSTSCDWVGNTRGSGIAFGILVLQKEGSDWPHLLAGLDNFKIVSLGLSKISNCPSNEVIKPFHIQSSLWVPCPPSEKGLNFSPLLPESRLSRAFEPLTNIDFGGPGGELLRLLTRLTFYMTAGPLPFKGIEIFYADRKPLLYGTRSGCGLSFVIDGSKGEHIDHVSIVENGSEYDPEIILGGLQVHIKYFLGLITILTLFSDLNKFWKNY